MIVMKSQPFPRRSSPLLSRSATTDESQVVVVQRAPCRNRTCNLMIKSHIRASHSARTGAVQLAPSASKLVELVPPTHPNKARRFHDSIPELASPSDLIYGNPDLVFAGGGWGTL